MCHWENKINSGYFKTHRYTKISKQIFPWLQQFLHKVDIQNVMKLWFYRKNYHHPSIIHIKNLNKNPNKLIFYMKENFDNFFSVNTNVNNRNPFDADDVIATMNQISHR